MNPLWNNIPQELRRCKAWVVCDDSKVPHQPNGFPASTTDPSTWSTFEAVCAAGWKHVGFCFAKEFGYTGIDLDNPATIKFNGAVALNPNTEEVAAITERHKRILSAFNSYTELSASGAGVHIILKGFVPSGVRKDKVEVYSEARFFIFTGNVINPAPITDHQPLLDAMHWEMSVTSKSLDLVEVESTATDESLIQSAQVAANADKFNALWRAELNGYLSQSEADFALLAMLAFYSQSNEQVRRLFRQSALGQRDKAVKNDIYLDRALSKIRGRQEASAIPYVDISGLLAKHAISYPIPPPPPVIPILPACFPPGLLGEVADFIYSSAIRPVAEVALTAALAFGAGIMGRNFNISSTGLNQYIIFLGSTGVGKEGASGGIESLISAVRGQVPGADEFIGPSAFASGQALTRALDKNNCFLSIMGEIGITLQQICDKRAGSHQIQFRKVLLDLYGKSGWSKSLRPSVYSDTDKNTGIVHAPNVTIFGESTPDRFYNVLDNEHIAEGLIPRFLVIEYIGPRLPSNLNAFHAPSPRLISRLVDMFQTVLAMKHNNTMAHVQIDPYAKAILDAYNEHADRQINEGDDEVTKQLWNRAHLKALKLAGLVAVGCDLHRPVVTREIAEWATALVNRDVDNMIAKFSSGDVGQGDHKCEADVKRAINKYVQLSEKQRRDFNVPQLLVDKSQCIPFVYLKKFCTMRTAFKNDRRGAVVALNTTLADMLKAGMLAQMPSEQARKELGVEAPVYVRGEAWS